MRKAVGETFTIRPKGKLSTKKGVYFSTFDVRVRVVDEKKPPRMVKLPITKERPVVKAKTPVVKKKMV